jgi:hypothetical protein
MSKLFRFVTSILVLVMATSMSHTHGQTQSARLSDEDEAEILESLLQLATKPLDPDFGGTRTFSSENISSVSASRLKQLGFSLLWAPDIERSKREHVIDYVLIREMYPKDGIVVVRLSVVSEGRPCFAPAFSTQRSFTYYFEKSGKQWVGRLVKRPAPFPFSRSLGDATVTPHFPTWPRLLPEN